jgi:stage II sporulation SpoAA-like protein
MRPADARDHRAEHRDRPRVRLATGPGSEQHRRSVVIERISDIPAGIFGVRATGTLTTEDYETVVEPVVDDVTRHRTRLRCLVEVGPDFTGVTPAAAWEDVRLGLRAMRAFDGCAVLTDHDRVAAASRVAAFLMPCPVRVFAPGERAAAVEWLTGLPGGAAIRPSFVETGVIVVEVREPLRAEDLLLLGQLVNGWLADHATLPGLVVHTRRVPGWASRGALLRHVGFVAGPPTARTGGAGQ